MICGHALKLFEGLLSLLVCEQHALEGDGAAEGAAVEIELHFLSLHPDPLRKFLNIWLYLQVNFAIFGIYINSDSMPIPFSLFPSLFLLNCHLNFAITALNTPHLE